MMNKNIKQKIAQIAGTLAVFALLFSLVVPSQALASKDDWYLGDFGFGGDTYYEDTPIYGYYDNYDTYYEDTPIYGYYDNYDTYYEDTPIYGTYDNYQPYEYNTPAYTPNYSTPQYYATPDYGGQSYTPYTPSYSSPSYAQYTPPVYVPTQSQTQGQSNTGINTNNNTSSSNSSANATSANTNNNVNNNNNVSNNVNTNNVNVIVGTPITQAQAQPQQPQQQNLGGDCYITPSNVTINQDVTLTANAFGGNGNYTYSWYGSDGISSNSKTFTGRFTTSGVKTATVTITSGGQSISRSCSVTVDQVIYNNNNLSAYCVASPTNATIGQTVVWTAYVTGGNYNNGSYTYSWYGTDGLSYGNASSIQKSYTTPGSKTATVTIYGNGQSISASCYTNVTGYVVPSNVTVIRQPTTPAPTSGVYLSQIPATGINFSVKVALFILGLIIWSAFMGYTFMARSKKKSAHKLALAGNAGASMAGQSVADRIQAFKLANMQKQGLR